MSWSTFFSKRWRWATLLVLLLTAVFVRLGIWQLDRLEQRRAQNQQVLAVLNTPAYEMDAALMPAAQQIPGRWVTVTGTYDLDHQMLLLLQNWQGRAGVNLITPLLLDGDKTADSEPVEVAVLIDRGWIPDSERDNLAAYGVTGPVTLTDPVTLTGSVTMTGPVTLTAYVALPELLDRQTTADTSFQPEIYRVDTAVLQTQLPYDLQPVYLVIPPDDMGNSEWPYRQPREIDISDGPHLGYALQWLAFALIAIGGYAYFVRRSEREGEK
jgi:surfeit locus 1 family protein